MSEHLTDNQAKKFTSFTPGPWSVEDDYLVYSPDTEYPVAEVRSALGSRWPSQRKTDWPTAHANARLIATAPELFGLLAEALEDWQNHNGVTTDPNHPHWSNRARAALARAVQP